MKPNNPKDNINSTWRRVKISDLLDYERPDNYIVESDHYVTDGKTPVLTANKSFILGYTNEESGIYKDVPAIIFDDFTTDSKYVDFPFKIKSSAIKILKNKEGADLRFVYEKMKSINFPTGSHKRFYISQYQNMEVLMPPIDEQKMIAEILATVDEEIQKTDGLITATEELKNGLMQRFFGGKNDNKTELGNFVKINPKLDKKLNDDEIVGFISMSDVSNDAKVLNIQDRKFKEVKKGFTYFRPKDILFAKITPCMENGKGGIAPDNFSVFFGSTEFFVLRVERGVLPEYIYYFVNQINFRKMAERNMRGSAGQKRVPKEFLENYKITIPSIEEQRRNVKILFDIDSKIGINKKIKEKLTLLKKGLMQDLLSGKVRVA
jgi:type I restriction enzyme S subunit